MSKLSLAIIPIFVLVAVLGVAVYLKLMSSSPKTSQALPQVNTAETSPGSGYGVINPSDSGTTATDLNAELDATVDDGGASELNDLNQTVGSL